MDIVLQVAIQGAAVAFDHGSLACLRFVRRFAFARYATGVQQPERTRAPYMFTTTTPGLACHCNSGANSQTASVKPPFILLGKRWGRPVRCTRQRMYPPLHMNLSGLCLCKGEAEIGPDESSRPYSTHG